MVVPEQQLVKITEALEYCDKQLEGFFKALDNVELPEETLEKFKFLILTKTFFAGGVFRSILTDESVKDVDIFFIDEDSAFEFLTTVLKLDPLSKMFQSPTVFDTLNWGKLSFITHNYGEPMNVVCSFDFTFNKHYYQPFKQKMSFNTGVFTKEGMMLRQPSPEKLVGLFARMLRFSTEGYKFDSWTLENLLTGMYDNSKEKAATFKSAVANSGGMDGFKGTHNKRFRDLKEGDIIFTKKKVKPNNAYTQYYGKKAGMVYSDEVNTTPLDRGVWVNNPAAPIATHNTVNEFFPF